MNMINLPSPHLQAASAMILICNFFIHVEKVLFPLRRWKLTSPPCIYTQHWCCVQNEGKNVKSAKRHCDWLWVPKLYSIWPVYIAYLEVCPIRALLCFAKYRVNVENIKYRETYLIELFLLIEMLQCEHAVCTFSLRLQNAAWPRKFDYTNRSSVSQVIVSIVVVSLKRFGWMIKEIHWLRYKFNATWPRKFDYAIRIHLTTSVGCLSKNIAKRESAKMGRILVPCAKATWHCGICAIFGNRHQNLWAHDVKWKFPLRSVFFVAGNRYSFQLCWFVCCTGILRWHCDC